jgi:glycosyltransferase involved in cell wall biosynthesis
MNIYFLSFRIAGNDGVTLEAKHWRNILEKMGHNVTFIAGELDEPGILIPELHFNFPAIKKIHDSLVIENRKVNDLKIEIDHYREIIKNKLNELLKINGKPDILIAANVLSLPMNFSAAPAIIDFINENKIKTLGRHHDFWWERERFQKDNLIPYFKKWFPGNSQYIYHTVINSLTKEEFIKRLNVIPGVFPDSFDFSSQLDIVDDVSKSFRSEFGLREDDIVFLQATRIIPRKRIELGIDLVKKLNNPKAVLVIAGRGGDEAPEYFEYLMDYAANSGIKCLFIGDQVDSFRSFKSATGKQIYTLWDCYNNADFVTYPSLIEGFGNQFIEAVYFKKPIFVANYPVFEKDIAPLGFNVIAINNEVTLESVNETKSLIAFPQKIKEMTENNFNLGKKFFSYEATQSRLNEFFTKMNLTTVMQFT